MDTFKVSIFRSVSCLYQSFKSGFHKSSYTTAENSLLTEKVCFCLYFKGRFQNTCSCAA